MEELNRKAGEWQRLKFLAGENGEEKEYSRLLRNIVVGMCHPEEKERLNSLAVEEMLRPYQN